MSREEILALSPEALFAAVRTRLFPGVSDKDCERAMNYGYDRKGPGVIGPGFPCHCLWSSKVHERCPEHLCEGVPIFGDLSGWSGAGLMVEAMRERGYCIQTDCNHRGYCASLYRNGARQQGYSEDVAEAFARACLLALENQP